MSDPVTLIELPAFWSSYHNRPDGRDWETNLQLARAEGSSDDDDPAHWLVTLVDNGEQRVLCHILDDEALESLHRWIGEHLKGLRRWPRR